jgi:hypothetical protein
MQRQRQRAPHLLHHRPLVGVVRPQAAVRGEGAQAGAGARRGAERRAVEAGEEVKQQVVR